MSYPTVHYDTTQADTNAASSAKGYVQGLLQSYLSTQGKTSTQSASELAANVSALAPVALKADKTQRMGDLRFLQKHGQEIRDLDPRTEALLKRLQSKVQIGSRPTELTQLLDKTALEAGPTELTQSLTGAAQRELALGGQLSEDELRNIEQGSRSTWGDRGLLMSNPAMVQEVMNRSAASDARMRERQGFASNVNQLGIAETTGNRTFQLGVADLDERRRVNTGNLLADVVKLRQASNPQSFISRPTNTSTLFGAGGQIGSESGAGARTLAGLQDAYAGFIMNRTQSTAIANANAEAGRQALSIQEKTARNAATMALWGSVIESVGNVAGAAAGACWVAREVYGEGNQRWRCFFIWLHFFAPVRRRERYIKNGQKIAAWVKTHPQWKPMLHAWMERCIETMLC